MFKKLGTIALALLLTAAFAIAPAMAEATSTANTITVQGSKTLTIEADYATINLGVSVTAPTVGEAQTQNATLLNGVISALKEQGIDQKDITTSSFNVYPQYDYNNYDESGNSLLKGYKVENMLLVTVGDLDKVSAVLDAGMAAGANQSYGIQFLSSKQSEAYEQALADAVADGASKAAILAKASNKTLGDVTAITENNSGYNNYTRVAKYEMAADEGSSTPIIAGEISVSATVTLTYSFQ